MDSENLGIKEVENILGHQIQDWLRWGRRRDYLPPSFRCTLGFLYVPKRGDLEARLYRPAPINELDVIAFERIVVGLPTKHREAFVMYTLGRFERNGRMVSKKLSGKEIAQRLGVDRSWYYVLLTQAHNMILREWRKLHDRNT